jgi:predicted GIY-YIG superfamily endonuclease
MPMFHVYILLCSDGSLYTGHTDDLEKRLHEHNVGTFQDCYTFTRRPLKLVFNEGFHSRVEALQAERKIKTWGRRKKFTLVYKGWEGILRLRKTKCPSIRAKGSPSGRTVSDE